MFSSHPKNIKFVNGRRFGELILAPFAPEFRDLSFSPNSAGTMGFWRVLRLVIVRQDFPASPTFPDTENHQKTMSLLTFSKKKRCWRSSFGVYHFVFWWMLELICLFLLQNSLGSLGVAWGWTPVKIRRFFSGLQLKWWDFFWTPVKIAWFFLSAS